MLVLSGLAGLSKGVWSRDVLPYTIGCFQVHLPYTITATVKGSRGPSKVYSVNSYSWLCGHSYVQNSLRPWLSYEFAVLNTGGNTQLPSKYHNSKHYTSCGGHIASNDTDNYKSRCSTQ